MLEAILDRQQKQKLLIRRYNPREIWGKVLRHHYKFKLLVYICRLLCENIAMKNYLDSQIKCYIHIITSIS